MQLHLVKRGRIGKGNLAWETGQVADDSTGKVNRGVKSGFTITAQKNQCAVALG